ncbi:MAG: MFS transporter [Acidobacteria bacterium]|nr:MFS transporter [Acidobacteriota bacterium]
MAHGAMMVFGIVMALIGAVTPALAGRVDLEIADIGRLFLAMNAAMLAASLVLGVVVDRGGLRMPMVAGALLVAGGLFTVAHAAGTQALVVGVVALGAGGGALNGASNILIADLHEDEHRKSVALNRLGVFFGIGAVVMPFAVSFLVAHVGLGGVLSAAAVLCVALGLSAILFAFPLPKLPQGRPLAALPRYLRQPVVLALGVLLFFQSGNEFLLGGYIANVLTRDLGASVTTASLWLAAFWSAIMVTRLAMGQILARVSGPRVVVVAALGAAVASVGVVVAPTPLIAGLAATSAGLLLSPIFPTVLGVAGARYREQSGAVFGVLFAVALTGGMTMPWLAGHLAARTGLRWVFLLAAANFVMVAMAMRLVDRTLHRWR